MVFSLGAIRLRNSWGETCLSNMGNTTEVQLLLTTSKILSSVRLFCTSGKVAQRNLKMQAFFRRLFLTFGQYQLASNLAPNYACHCMVGVLSCNVSAKMKHNGREKPA